MKPPRLDDMLGMVVQMTPDQRAQVTVRFESIEAALAFMNYVRECQDKEPVS